MSRHSLTPFCFVICGFGVPGNAVAQGPDQAVPPLALPDPEVPDFDDAPERDARPHVLLANYSYTMAKPLQANTVFTDTLLWGGAVLIDVRVWPPRRDDEDRWDWDRNRAKGSVNLYFGWHVESGVNQLDDSSRATLLMHNARAGVLLNLDITQGFRIFFRGGGAMPYVDMRYSQEGDPEFGESNIDEWRHSGWTRPCAEASAGLSPSLATRDRAFPRIGLALEVFTKYCMEQPINDHQSAPVAEQMVKLWTLGGAVSAVAAF